LKEAKQKLEQERAAKREQQVIVPRTRGRDLVAGIKLDQELIVARMQGRQGWLRDANSVPVVNRTRGGSPASRLGPLLVGE
jgi:hypothetical protein